MTADSHHALNIGMPFEHVWLTALANSNRTQQDSQNLNANANLCPVEKQRPAQAGSCA